MVHREEGLQALYERAKAVKDTLGIKTFRRVPVASVEDDDLLCLFMLEDRDVIVQQSARSWLGYPARRELDVIFEMINLKVIDDVEFDIRQFYIDLRDALLVSPELVKGCSIREVSSMGPRSYGKPNVIGMQMVLRMTYMDEGVKQT